MKYVVAVSGGVDSVVLLHKFTRHPELEIIVAHFDHGIRDDSAEDARFVQELARDYGLPFETKREELGKGASEEQARDRRYEFLRFVADKYSARLVTAHHADDAVETVAINVTRGTGWRGLAVLDSDVARPLLDMSKQEILDYAKRHNLKWHEDSTNASDAYLRNRIRRKTSSLSTDEKRQILGLRAHQIASKKAIDSEVRKLVGDGPTYSRYFFIHAENSTAIECLRYVSQAHLTRPQLERALLAIKTSKAGSIYEAGSGVQIRFTSRNFTVELIK
ncbi:tRNA lysidine(34) synthetase TilS [Patescibacteria group bacterium]|nr:MAG: tRNA lysidine(34) synthetase TilS [Patescibacteria group bacterium]